MQTQPHILTIVGARPQFVKAAVVSREFAARGIPEVLVHTGQHYDDDMSSVFFRQLGMAPPDHMLDVGSGGHGVQTGRMLALIEDLLVARRPAAVLVYGDTNSTLAGGLAAAKLGVPVAHVEAGLRSFNRAMPEEINRVLTDHLAARLYAPTRAAVANLAAEGIAGPQVVACGDVMFDAVRTFAPLALADPARVSALGVAPGEFVLATVHRAATVDDPASLKAVFDGLAAVAEHVPVLLPVHPRTRARAEALGILKTLPETFKVVGPVGYLT
jgi:UDP-GlcNAc3NAcA epimerase